MKIDAKNMEMKIFLEPFFLSVFLGHTKTHIELASDIAIKSKKKTKKSFVICFWRWPTKRTIDAEKKRANKRRKNNKANNIGHTS